jgi:hypothetical protein
MSTDTTKPDTTPAPETEPTKPVEGDEGVERNFDA